MTTDVVVLADGYSRMISHNTMLADGTCSLVKTRDELILVDCLGPWNSVKLIELINKQGFHLSDISLIIGTHTHSDHIGNLNLFTNQTQEMANMITNQFNDKSVDDTLRSKIKKHIVGDCVYNDDKYEFDLFENEIFRINSNIYIRKTPGHTRNCISLLIDNVSNKGRVAITGDLFECESDLKNESIWINAGSELIDQQRLNRKFILDNFDWIIPGHGPMFQNK